MTRLYGLWGLGSQSWITIGGRVLAHTDPAELEFLLPGSVQVRELAGGAAAEDVLLIRDHPQFASVTFPIRREDFHHA